VGEKDHQAGVIKRDQKIYLSSPVEIWIEKKKAPEVTNKD